MGYIEKNLMPGEAVLLRPHYHPVRFVPGASGILLGALVAAAGTFFMPVGTASTGPILAVGGVLAVAGLAIIALRAFVDSFDEFAVTSMRIIKKTGFVTRKVLQVPLDKVQDLRLAATLWGRWLSYGDVEIQSAAEDGPVIFPRIQNPEEFRNALFTRQQRVAAVAAPVAAVAAPAVGRAATAEDRLKEVERLRKSGVLTEEEYAAKRQELIREL